MTSPAYHRLTVGYHGCTKTTAEEAILLRRRLRPSKNPYDWLGHGLYFWEHSPHRALEFANEQAIRDPKKVPEPFVLGAYIYLGRCLDLTDRQATEQIAAFFPHFERTFAEAGAAMPVNQAADDDDNDLLLRHLDCAVLNAFLRTTDYSDNEVYYQTVRGVFLEGQPIFEGSRMYTKTHVQISVRDQSCIMGYFLPQDSGPQS